MAESWIANNSVTNKNLSVATVRRYQEDILAGNWVFNGEAIRFDTNGHLRDGYHRMTALKSCKGKIDGIDMTVMVGIDPTSADLYDSGMKRTTTHYMKFKYSSDKFKYSKPITALANMYYMMTEENNKPSNAQVEFFILNNNDVLYKLYTHMNINKSSSKIQSSRKSILYACYKAILANEPEESIYQFMRVFNSGKMEDVKDDIIINFRESYIKEFNGKGGNNKNEKDLLKMAETYIYKYNHPERKKKYSLAECSYYYSM